MFICPSALLVCEIPEGKDPACLVSLPSYAISICWMNATVVNCFTYFKIWQNTKNRIILFPTPLSTSFSFCCSFFSGHVNLKHPRHISVLGFLHWLFPLPGTLSLLISTWLPPSFIPVLTSQGGLPWPSSIQLQPLSPIKPCPPCHSTYPSKTL